MTSKNMKARRKAFEAWYSEAIWGNEDFKQGMERAWNAALDSIRVELPQSVSCGTAFPCKCYEGGWNDALAECQEALTVAGVSFK